MVAGGGASVSVAANEIVRPDTSPAVSERVLIVEDDGAARVGLEQLVKSWGFVAESAVDGEDALQKVTTFRPSIVISDLVMPRMDGLELLRALQSQGADVTTLEGLGTVEKPHPIQQAFIDEQAVQCGFCLSGVILTAKAYLDRNPKASESDVRNAMSGVLCRCGANTRMLKAIGRYARGPKA